MVDLASGPLTNVSTYTGWVLGSTSGAGTHDTGGERNTGYLIRLPGTVGSACNITWGSASRDANSVLVP